MLRQKLRTILQKLGGARKVTPPRDTITQADLADAVDQFEEWRSENPDLPAWRSGLDYWRRALSGAEVHSTIGGNLRSGEFEKAGLGDFNTLLSFGLMPDHVCVDYGCGTLRVGQHIIKYVRPGCYWGFELDASYFETGRGLIGADLVAEKSPELRTISNDTVSEAASRKPSLVFSNKVMQHVHPDDLGEYLANIATLAGTWGQGFILNSRWREAETVQYKPLGWAHNLSTIGKLCAGHGMRVEVLSAKSRPLPLENAGNAFNGSLRIASA